MRTLVLFYSSFGHTYQMAKAIAEGDGQVDGVGVEMRRVPETLPEEIWKAMGALPYSFQGQMRIDEITGGSPYGASTIAGGKGERLPSANELGAARFQGRHVASIASRLVR